MAGCDIRGESPNKRWQGVTRRDGGQDKKMGKCDTRKRGWSKKKMAHYDMRRGRSRRKDGKVRHEEREVKTKI